MIDLHNHLLYHLDDGAENIAESIAMLEDARRNGITGIVATPHVLPAASREQYQQVFEHVAAEARQRGITLYHGAEYNGRCLPESSPYLTLGGRSPGTVLVDFRIPGIPPEFLCLTDDIFNQGYRLIIAHPERTFPPVMLRDLEILAERGVYYQITAASLLGNFGFSVKKMAWVLLKSGLARLIASDAHNAQDRGNHLRAAYEAVRKKLGSAAVETLQNNARNAAFSARTTLAPIPLRRFRLDFLHGFGR